MRLIFIRHGQTLWNTQHRAQGRTDIPLDETGRRQAERLADALSHRRLDHIYASPLSRAVETARPIAEKTGAALATDELLTEIAFGAWEGLSFDEIDRRYPHEMADWRLHPFSCHIPDAESPEEVLQRMRQFLTKLDLASCSTVAVVSHTLPLKVTIADAMGLPYDRMHVLRLDNVGYTEIEFGPSGKNTVLCLNNTSHLAEGELVWGTLR